MCSDLVKTRSTYFKLIALHREFNQQEQVIECYTQILSTYDKSCGDLSVSDSNDLSKTWLEFGIYLMTRDAILNKDWVKVCIVGEAVCTGKGSRICFQHLIEKLVNEGEIN